MWYTSSRFWSFVGGIGAAVLVSAASKTPKTRAVAVVALSKGMRIKDRLAQGMESIKDDADDMAEEARREAKVDAAASDRRAKIEARVRKEVEAQVAAEEKSAARAEAKKAVAAKNSASQHKSSSKRNTK